MCQQCGVSFADRVFIDGKWRHLHGRLYCVACRPFKARRSPRFITPRPVQMKTCVACGREFPSKLRINGVMRSLYRRKFCLECSPFGEHNTSKKPAGASDDADAFRKRRRTDSWCDISGSGGESGKSGSSLSGEANVRTAAMGPAAPPWNSTIETREPKSSASET